MRVNLLKRKAETRVMEAEQKYTPHHRSVLAGGRQIADD
jgi:hypothetical protein